MFQQVVERNPGIQDILEQDYIAVQQVGHRRKVQADGSRGFRSRPVSAYLNKMGTYRHVELSNEVGHEYGSALQDANHIEGLLPVLLVQLQGQFLDPTDNLVLGNQDFVLVHSRNSIFRIFLVWSVTLY